MSRGGRKFDSGLLNVEVDGMFLGEIGRFVEYNVRFVMGYKGLLVVLRLVNYRMDYLSIRII